MVVARRAAEAALLPHTAATCAAHHSGASPSAKTGEASLRVLVIQHCPLTPVGLVGEAAERAGADLTTIMPHHGDGFPDEPDAFDGLVICGGPMHAGDDTGYPAFPPILRLIRRFHGGGRPVLGLCLGAQLIARAFGRDIVKWRELELGFPVLKLSAEGRADRLLRGTSPRPRPMQFHEDTFDLPEGAKLLIAGDCPHQGFRLGDTTYGFQFHMEVTRADAHAWLRDCRDWIGRHWGADAGRRTAEIEKEISRYHPAAAEWTRAVAGRWLELAAERKLWRREPWPLQVAG